MRLIDENQSIDSNGNSTSGDHVIAWSRAKKRLQVKLGSSVFDRWISPLELEGVQHGCATLRAPGEYVRYYVDTHFRDQIRQSLKSEIATVTQIELRAVLEESRAAAAEQSSASQTVRAQTVPLAEAPATSTEALLGGGDGGGLRLILPRNKTFENFVVGQSNKIAYMAAKRFVEAPTEALNPLFIHGKVGTGKSHLAKAIAVAAANNEPASNVVYLSAERFMYHFVRSLKDKNTLAFKEALRDVSVLVLDDVGFIGNKASTREEFFHTVDILLSEGRRVVCCADVPPSRLEGMGERIVSRLGQGTVVGIDTPDFELRRNILKAKLDAASRESGQQIQLAEQLFDFMASNLTDNVRTLEGAVNRIVSHSGTQGEIGIDVLKSQIISDLLQTRKPTLTIKEIQKCVADYFGLQISDLCSKRRTKDVVKARHLAMYMIRKETTKSYPQIAMKFGKMDHTSILHAVRKIEALSETDPEICEHIEGIRRKLGL